MVPRWADGVSVAGGVGVKCPHWKPVALSSLSQMPFSPLAQLRLTPVRDVRQDVVHSQPKSPEMTPVPPAREHLAASSTTKEQLTAVEKNSLWREHRRTPLRRAAPGPGVQATRKVGPQDVYADTGAREKANARWRLRLGAGQDCLGWVKGSWVSIT